MTAKATWLHIPEWLTDDVWHFPYAYETFKKYIPPRALALEIGFGSGRIMARIAKELHCTCVGVDVEDSAFSSLAFFSQQHGATTAPVRGSGFSLPFKDNSFDAVYSEGVIEHFPVAQSEEMLAEHARVCRDGGVVIVSVPNKFAVFHSLAKLLLGERFMFYPEASLSTFQLSRLMTRVGLTPERHDGFAFGCQFYMFKALFLDQTLPPKSQQLGLRILSWLGGTGLYHFDSPGLNSLIGFQTLTVARK